MSTEKPGLRPPNAIRITSCEMSAVNRRNAPLSRQGHRPVARPGQQPAPSDLGSLTSDL
jgi:hypothetical protein